MKQQHHIEYASRTAVREAACIDNMIADMQRVVQVLDCDVSTEEERARVRDRSDARYSILARQLATRRDNLKATIAALEARLSSINVSTPFEITRAA
jgi:septation ring formation regulator EzrA